MQLERRDQTRHRHYRRRQHLMLYFAGATFAAFVEAALTCFL
jgi:hypothetical protein